MELTRSVFQMRRIDMSPDLVCDVARAVLQLQTTDLQSVETKARVKGQLNRM